MGALKEWLAPLMSKDTTATECIVAVSLYRIKQAFARDTAKFFNQDAAWMHLGNPNVESSLQHRSHMFGKTNLMEETTIARYISTVEMVASQITNGYRERGHYNGESGLMPCCVLFLPKYMSMHPLEASCPYYNIYDNLILKDDLLRCVSIGTIAVLRENVDDFLCREEEKVLLEQWTLGAHPSGRRTVREPIRKLIRTA